MKVQRLGRPQAQQQKKTAQQHFNPERIRNAMQKARQSGDKKQIAKIELHIKKMRAQHQSLSAKGPQNRPTMRQRGQQMQGRTMGRQNRPQGPMMQGKGPGRGMGQGFGPQKGAMQGRRMGRQNRPQGPMMQGRQFGQQQQRPMTQRKQMGQKFGRMQGQMQHRGMEQRFGQGGPGNMSQSHPPFGNRPFRF